MTHIEPYPKKLTIKLNAPYHFALYTPNRYTLSFPFSYLSISSNSVAKDLTVLMLEKLSSAIVEITALLSWIVL